MAAKVGHDQMKSGNAKRQTGVVEHNTISGTSAAFDTQHSSVHERNSLDVRKTQPGNSRRISRLGQFFVKVDLDLPHSYFRRTTQSLQRLFRYHKLEH